MRVDKSRLMDQAMTYRQELAATVQTKTMKCTDNQLEPSIEVKGPRVRASN